MRLKSSDGPLSVHNGNANFDILNSPKRINTLHNSNVGSILTTSDVIETSTTVNATINNERTFNNINTDDVVQWCNSQRLLQKEREITNNANNRNQLFNINNTLDTNLVSLRHQTASSVCSESSPDDSLLEFEETNQRYSSAENSPQDEEHGFDISDSETASEDGNVSHHLSHQHRGIVNPNYPGFQHLAHTLDYSIKPASDTDFTDDEFDCDILTAHTDADINNINNNNNGDEDTDQHIDSVNRLDSVENIKKVLYDKPVFNIPLECEHVKPEANTSAETSCTSNQTSDDDSEAHLPGNIEFNIKTEEPTVKLNHKHEAAVEDGTTNSHGGAIAHEHAFVQELDETFEKISLCESLEPITAKLAVHPEEKFTLEAVTEQVVYETAIAKRDPMTTLMQRPLHAEFPQEQLKSDFGAVDAYEMKIGDAFLSGTQEMIPPVQEKLFQPDNDMDIENERKWSTCDSNREAGDFLHHTKQSKPDPYETEKFCKEDKTKDEKEKDEDSAVPRKKEKVDVACLRKRKDYNQQMASLITVPRRELGSRNRDGLNRRTIPSMREKKRAQPDNLCGFDVYNIETAMPKIDLEAIESHLKAAREEERRRRTDREEIRRRLAMGAEDDYYNNYDRPGRKPSLQARLQSGMNLQICFMNETVSDTESPNSDTENTMMSAKQQKRNTKNNNLTAKEENNTSAPVQRPATLNLGQPLLQPLTQPMTEVDFFARQARLQTEARMALAQAKEMARMQMEIERQRQKKSPITEMVRNSLEKVGIPFPEEKRRLSRQILTEMNVAQLQVIVNDLHTQIEILNENLVKYLMERDDLHMEQDSMLVDIEDLTRYLGAKEQTIKEQSTTQQNNNMPPPSPAPSSPLSSLNSSVKPHLQRIASLVKK